MIAKAGIGLKRNEENITKHGRFLKQPLYQENRVKYSSRTGVKGAS